MSTVIQLGKYQPYPEYKESGDEWLGKVPAQWSVTKLKHVTSIFGRIGFRGYTVDDIVSEGEGALVLSPSNIVGASISLEKKTFISWRKYYESPEIMVSDGDVILVKTGSTFGKSALIDAVSEPTTINPQMALLKKSKIDSRFIAYLLNTTEIKAKIDINNTGSGMPTMTQENINGFPVPLPDGNGTTRISEFLDYETARIDQLIARQKQLIELLKEKRQAEISHAVTKGLDPNAPMKESGVEWLGQVPEHWVVKPLRHLGCCQNGLNIGAEAFGSGYPFVSYGDAYKNRVLPETGSGLVQSTPEDRRKYSLLVGDILFTRTSETIEEIGFASACLKAIDNACFAGFLIRFRPNTLDLDVEYSKYYFSNQLLRTFFTKEMNLITRASLSQDLLKTMPVVLPPSGEQKRIAAVLDEQSKRFEQLKLLGEEQIKLLQERRTALISAAVTGKIDLRGWQPPKREVAA